MISLSALTERRMFYGSVYCMGFHLNEVTGSIYSEYVSGVKILSSFEEKAL